MLFLLCYLLDIHCLKNRFISDFMIEASYDGRGVYPRNITPGIETRITKIGQRKLSNKLLYKLDNIVMFVGLYHYVSNSSLLWNNPIKIYILCFYYLNSISFLKAKPQIKSENWKWKHVVVFYIHLGLTYYYA